MIFAGIERRSKTSFEQSSKMALRLVTALTGAAALHWSKLLTILPVNRHQSVTDPIRRGQERKRNVMSFIGPNFLLQTDAARQLYSAYAQPQPILDFHTHLSPQDIADNRPFNDLYDIWIEGDHYKWRAMRANGVAERFCTGNASAY